MMKVTYHATQRFLERVLNKSTYTRNEFDETKEKLEELFLNMIPGSYARPFSLPGHKGFSVVHQENCVITIIPKNKTKNRFKRRYI